MESDMTVVIQDAQTLSAICGINDDNLRVMEELIESRILSRGNELSIAGTDKGKEEIFVRMLSAIEEQVKRGRTAGPELIRTIYRGISEGETVETRLFRETALRIPGTMAHIYPRSQRQALYMDAMTRHDIVFSVGPAGTGKTYLAVAHALHEMLGRKKKKLILTRPVVEAGESLGFLPGDFTQKISPYLRPLYDAMDALISPETISRLEENRIIEIVPLAYMRGRSLANSYIILDEAQNTPKEQMKMFLTRIGEGSKAVVTGDITQIDLPKRVQSGMIHAMRILASVPEIAFIHFSNQDVIRNPLVRKIVQAYDAENPL